MHDLNEDDIIVVNKNKRPSKILQRSHKTGPTQSSCIAIETQHKNYGLWVSVTHCLILQ